MPEAGKPFHDLLEIQQLCRRGQCQVNYRCLPDAALLGFDEDDVIDCVLALHPEHFYKSNPSNHQNFKEHMQDVYRLEYEGKRVYLKLDLFDGLVSVISFHEDSSK